METQRTTVTVGSGVKAGFGAFIILPILLLFGSCAACTALMSTAVALRPILEPLNRWLQVLFYYAHH